MIDVQRTGEFNLWLAGLKDNIAKASIVARIRRLGQGNFGDSRPVGDGVSELRMHVGPGYRVYYKQTGTMIVVLLCGGDKSSQAKDIERAKRIAAEL